VSHCSGHTTAATSQPLCLAGALQKLDRQPHRGNHDSFRGDALGLSMLSLASSTFCWMSITIVTYASKPAEMREKCSQVKLLDLHAPGPMKVH
jgi:hypothetical protein